MKKLTEFLVKNIVEKPEEVVIEEKEEEGNTNILLTVANLDMGKIIGKNGRIIKSIRTLLRIKAIKNGQRVFLELTEKTPTQTLDT